MTFFPWQKISMTHYWEYLNIASRNCGKIWRNIQQLSGSPLCLAGYVLLLVSPVTDWVTCKKGDHLGQYYSSLLISTWLPLTWHFSPPHPIQQIAQMVHEFILAFEIWVYFLTLLIWDRLLQQGYFPLVHNQWPGKWGPAWFQLAAFFFFFHWAGHAFDLTPHWGGVYIQCPSRLWIPIDFSLSVLSSFIILECQLYYLVHTKYSHPGIIQRKILAGCYIWLPGKYSNY